MIYYTIFSGPDEYYHTAFKNLGQEKNVTFQNTYLFKENRIKAFLHKIHYKIDRKIHTPFRELWYTQYCREKYAKGNQYIFIFFFSWHEIFGKGYIRFLRRKYPGCKCVLYLTDINRAETLDMDIEKKRFDYIWSFEKNFAQKYQVGYYPLVYENENIAGLKKERPIDLLFVGRSKGRYSFLCEVYKKLSQEGLNCQFYVCDLETLTEQVTEGIHIVREVPYQKTIDLLKKAKCVLDIVPSGLNCSTLRVSEALAYNNKILTNNSYILQENFYDKEQISIYKEIKDIDIAFLKNEFENKPYKNKEHYSPASFLKCIYKTVCSSENQE